MDQMAAGNFANYVSQQYAGKYAQQMAQARPGAGAWTCTSNTSLSTSPNQAFPEWNTDTYCSNPSQAGVRAAMQALHDNFSSIVFPDQTGHEQGSYQGSTLTSTHAGDLDPSGATFHDTMRQNQGSTYGTQGFTNGTASAWARSGY